MTILLREIRTLVNQFGRENALGPEHAEIATVDRKRVREIYLRTSAAWENARMRLPTRAPALSNKELQGKLEKENYGVANTRAPIYSHKTMVRACLLSLISPRNS